MSEGSKLAHVVAEVNLLAEVMEEVRRQGWADELGDVSLQGAATLVLAIETRMLRKTLAAGFDDGVNVNVNVKQGAG